MIDFSRGYTLGELIVWDIITVDGYFEGTESWDLPWHQQVWNQELDKLSNEQLKNADALLFGRVTYEGMYSYWHKEKGETADRMNTIQKLVVSRTRKTVEWNNSILLTGKVPQRIQSFKLRTNKDIYVFGSANLLATLITENLVDEYRICIAPHLNGRGRHLFESPIPKTNLSLSSIRQLSNGCVILAYRPIERDSLALGESRNSDLG